MNGISSKKTALQQTTKTQDIGFNKQTQNTGPESLFLPTTACVKKKA